MLDKIILFIFEYLLVLFVWFAIMLLMKRNIAKLRKTRMIIIQAYKGKHELTQSQKDALRTKATTLKAQGFTHMFINVYTPVFSMDAVLEYVATDGEFTQRAYIGKRGALSHGLGKNNKAGYSHTYGNSLELTLTNLDKFEHVVTV